MSLRGVLVLIGGGLAAGCAPRTDREVVVYTALDEEFSRPIFSEFSRRTGIEVRAKFDVESTKSVQLTQALFAERDRPRCDVFWNNESVNTRRLQQAGLLAPYASPQGGRYPPEFRDPGGQWYGFAARARILLINTNLVPEAERPDSILDLVDPRWQDRAALAKPLAGTTATHAACLFAAWGPERAEEFFRQVKANCRVLGGNRQVAQAVARGEVAWGLTDTDDALAELDAGAPVTIVFPDQRPSRLQHRVADQPLGVLVIPNTLAIIERAPHRAAAEQLVEFLLSPEIEGRLAAGPSGQIPLHPLGEVKSRVAPPGRGRKPPGRGRPGSLGHVVTQRVDFAAAAQQWERAAEFLRDEFAAAE